jgi:hypothetical protein
LEEQEAVEWRSWQLADQQSVSLMASITD